MTSSSNVDSAAESTEASATRKTPKLMIFAIVFANFGLWIAFFTPVILTLQLRVTELAPDSKETTLSLILGVSSIFGIVANPIVGRLSDRTTSRLGMRRPWLIAGIAIGFAGLVIMGLVPSVAVLVIGSCLALIGFSGTIAVLLALIPDHIPEHKRGLLGGLLGVSQALATIFGVVIGGALQNSVALAFIVPGAIGLVAVLFVVVVLRDRRLAPGTLPAFTARDFWSAFWTSPRKHPAFGLVWFSRFFIFLAFAGVVNYQLFFLTTQLGLTAEAATALIPLGLAAETATLVVSSILAGAVSDRVGRRKPFVIVASLIGTIGLVVLSLTTAIPGYFFALVLVGLAQGIYYSVDIPLVSSVLPDAVNDAAKDFGVFAIANQLPQTLAPAIAPLLLAVSFGSVIAGGGPNYTALFIGSAIFAIASAICILFVKGIK